MATTRQRKAARKNIKKARARAQPEGRARKAPGSTGAGKYYHIEVRPDEDFVTFRTQDVGRKGHIQRVAGRRSSGSWATVKWLVGKQDAHREGRRLVPDTKAARDLFDELGSRPVHKSGDRFTASDRPDVPERAKPTAAQKRARSANIKKAQAARRAR
jgi:hypothetical protein